VETNNSLPFLDVLVTERGSGLITDVYRKPRHARRYLHFKSDHPQHVKRGVFYSLVNRARVVYQERKGFSREIKTIKQDLMLNRYPQDFIDSVIKSRRSDRAYTDSIPHILLLYPVSGVCLRNLGILETASISGSFSEPNAPSGDLW
jgi:uncharacterized protein (UPF0335 family)